MYQYYNPNPTGRTMVGDCSIRAIAKALGVDWEKAYAMVVENGEDDGYSGDYMGNMTYRSSRRGMVSRDGKNGSEMVGRSYRRGRDAMGRYVSHDGYSYDNDMVSELKELMEEAPDDRTKQKLKRFIAEIESV